MFGIQSDDSPGGCRPKLTRFSPALFASRFRRGRRNTPHSREGRDSLAVSRCEVCGTSARLLQVATPTLVLVTLVIKVVCVPKKRSRTGDGEVAVHVQIDAEIHSGLCRFVAGICRLEFSFDRNVEDSTSRHACRAWLAFHTLASNTPRTVFLLSSLGMMNSALTRSPTVASVTWSLS